MTGRLNALARRARESASGGGKYLAVTGSQVAQLAGAFGMTLLLAKTLGPESYGAFAFFVACAGVVGAFSELGLFSAASRLIARESDQASVQRLLGGALVLALGLFIAFDLIMLGLAFLAEPVFGVDIEVPMLVAAPLAGGLGLDLVILYLCQASGHYRLLVAYNLIARPIPFVALAALHFSGVDSVTAACALYAAGPTIGAAFVFRGLRPDLTAVRASIRSIRAEVRRAGDTGLYVGRALGTSTYNLDRLLVVYFLDPEAVSYYALAFSFALPMVLASQSLASVSYRRLVASGSIPRKLVIASGAWLVAAALATAGAVVVVIKTVLPEYDPVLGIMLPALLTAVAMGALQLPNWFLMAHGHGRALRDIALTFTASNLLLNFTLIPAFGIKGAAYASLGSTCVSLALHLIRYRAARRPSAPALDAQGTGAAL